MAINKQPFSAANAPNNKENNETRSNNEAENIKKQADLHDAVKGLLPKMPFAQISPKRML